MSKNLLVRYIKLALAEAHSARVPQQLMQPKEEECGDGNEEQEEGVLEFSGVGAVAGFTAPLGASSDTGRKNRRQKK